MVHGRNSYKRSAALSQFVIHRSLCISTMQVGGRWDLRTGHVAVGESPGTRLCFGAVTPPGRFLSFLTSLFFPPGEFKSQTGLTLDCHRSFPRQTVRAILAAGERMQALTPVPAQRLAKRRCGVNAQRCYDPFAREKNAERSVLVPAFPNAKIRASREEPPKNNLLFLSTSCTLGIRLSVHHESGSRGPHSHLCPFYRWGV